MSIAATSTRAAAVVTLVAIHLASPGRLGAQFLTRESVTTAGAQGTGGGARVPTVSGDGRFVAFDSAAANLVATDSNGVRDVFVRDRLAGQTIRVSVASDGTQANGQSLLPAISGDGLSVAFLSDATNLVPGDTNGARDVFVHDLRSQVTTRVSVQPDGSQFDRGAYAMDDDRAALGISTDGRYVAFAATRSYLSFCNTRQETTAVYMNDRQTGQTEAVGATGGLAVYPSVSGDARYVAFHGGTDTGTYVFVRDRQTGGLETIAVAAGTTNQLSTVRYARISADGRYVAFENSRNRTISVHDRLTGQRTTFTGWAPSISGDGRFVVHSGGSVHDRQTGRSAALSISTAGALGNAVSFSPAVSADGRVVAFASEASNLVTGDTNGQDDIFVAHVGMDADVALEMTATGSAAPGSLLTYSITVRNRGPDAALNTVLTDILPEKTSFYSCEAPQGVACTGQRFSTASPQISIPLMPVNGSVTLSVTLFVSFVDAPTVVTNRVSASSFAADANLSNNEASITTLPGGTSCSFALTPASVGATSAGMTGIVTVTAATGCPWTATSNAAWITVATGASGSGNGTVSYSVAVNATGAARTGTLTVGGRTFTVTQAAPGAAAFTRYFAEGATSSFFDTRIALVNPGATAASVTLRFLKTTGQTVTTSIAVPAMARRTVDVRAIAGMEQAEFSTVIESDQLVVADRTMTWDGSGYGAHAETSIPNAATTWYLAEGATHSGFNLFYLIQNPGTGAATVQVTYLLPAPAPAVVKTYTVPALSRFTIWVNQEGAALANTDASAIVAVTNGVPVIVERAMYLDAGGITFGAGHESAGVVAPATSWFLAEGATGPYFDLFVLIANPTAADATVAATYLLPSGATIHRTYVVRANSRFTIFVDGEHPSLADTAVSTTITSTNGVGIIVERSMWWPGPTAATWHEAHNSPGATMTGTRWALAEGEVGGARSAQTYILVANTSPTTASVRVTLLFEDGTNASKDFSIGANSRFSVPVAAEFPASANRRFGALVESLGAVPAQIVVERAAYSNTGLAIWAAGTNALAARLE